MIIKENKREQNFTVQYGHLPMNLEEVLTVGISNNMFWVCCFIDIYNELVTRLVNEFPISSQIIGEDNEKEFIKLFGRILKLRNILRCFDDFERDSSVPVRDLQDYHPSRRWASWIAT